MTITLEQVERLRERADLTYEAARELLEETGGDVLEALIRLERQGGLNGSGKSAYYSTCPGGAEEAAPPPGSSGSGQRDLIPVPRREKQGSRFWAKVQELLAAAANLLRHCTINQFEVWRNGELMTSLPVLILIILLIVAPWVSLPLLVVGLLFSCKYRFSGPDLNREKINQVMDSVSSTVGSVVDQAREEFRRATKEKK